ncbi:beta strand repeat-containing protein [Flavobacterium terrigena]|uniref:Chaperone of endosialidase n=1 Tax=Flavobacterium terrigena TaxID=402734 RepID=A0A1H6SFW3_9FLAO|nr:hypothetical protein [Flavobacterium terrigena]SEI62332.1 hypothetical protein SAMN05660918_1186 [Flavobacterium terrigena]
MLFKKINYLLLLILCGFNGYSQTRTSSENSSPIDAKGVVVVDSITPTELKPKGFVQTGGIGTVNSSFLDSSEFWSLTGNTLATGNEFIGTINSLPLKFRVNNFERLQITNTGRFHVSNTSAFGGNTCLYFGQNAGNETSSGQWNIGFGPQVLTNITTGGANTAIGDQALTVNTTGTGNHGIGYRTLVNNTTGNNNTALGYSAGSGNVIGNENVFLGSGSGFSSTGNRNIFLGFWAGHTLTAGNNNVFIGDYANPNISTTGSDQLNIANKIYGSGVSGSAFIGIGVPNPQARLHTNGTLRFENLATSSNPNSILGTDSNGNVFKFSPNLFDGFWSLNGNSLTTGNEFIGTTSNHDVIFKRANTFSGRLGQNNTSMGFNSLTNLAPNYDFNTAFGVNNLTAPLSGNNNVAIGSNNLQSNTSGHSNIAVGTNSLSSNTIGYQNIGIGYSALNKNINGNTNTAVGNFALQANTTGSSNVAFGDQVLSKNTTGTLNSGVGHTALASNTIGDRNVALGTNALYSNVSGNNNNASGFNSLANNISGNNNNASGDHSLAGLSTGNGNAAYGFSSLGTLSNGNNNVALGNNSGYNLNNGNNNIFIGNNIQPLTNNVDDYLNIGNKIHGTGTAGNTKIGLGIISDPQANFHTNGTVRLQNMPYSSTIPTNILGTDGVGNVYNFNPSLIGSGNNIYNIDGVLTGNRQLSLNDKRLIFDGAGCGTRFNPRPYDTNNKSVVEVYTGNVPMKPNLLGNGFFKLHQEKAERYLTQGINDTASWLQSSRNPNNVSSTYPLIINPLGGNVGLGLDVSSPLGTSTSPTAVLHTKGTLRFEGLGDTTENNELLTVDSDGNVLKRDINSFNLNSNNIYNSNGSLTDNRYLGLDRKILNFYGDMFSQIFNPNLDSGFCPKGSGESFSTIHAESSYGESLIAPNYNKGYFKLRANQSGRNGASGTQLNFGIASDNSWMQSSSHFTNYRDNNCGNAISKLHLNPLGGYVGIGVQSATAQLHTIESVRFENLPLNEKAPNAILGTDVDGNVFNYDPSMFGTGASSDAWLLNGNLATNPGTGAGQNFVGTIDAKDLVFGVNSNEMLRITQTGRFKVRNIDGSNYTANLYIGGGNENFQVAGINANLAVGLGSLSLNTTGSSNTALGFNSLVENTVGSLNCSVGINSMFKNVDGSSNVSVGHNTMYSNISGGNNTALGNQVFENKQLGSFNTAIGSFAGFSLTDGTNNVLIGANTNTMNTVASNELNIGNWIFGKSGQIAIGSFNDLPQSFITNADYQLIVKKGIRTEKVRVDIASVKNWADYVFEDDYKLMSLKELDQYIKTNGHLPNIPTSEEVVKHGVDLGEMNSKLLEKVEELTLYTIDLNKKNESQQKVIDDLISRLEKLEKNNKQ